MDRALLHHSFVAEPPKHGRFGQLFSRPLWGPLFWHLGTGPKARVHGDIHTVFVLFLNCIFLIASCACIRLYVCIYIYKCNCLRYTRLFSKCIEFATRCLIHSPWLIHHSEIDGSQFPTRLELRTHINQYSDMRQVLFKGGISLDICFTWRIYHEPETNPPQILPWE